MPSNTTQTISRLLLPAGLLAILTLAGCASRSNSPTTRNQSLDPSDFRAGPEAHAVALSKSEPIEIEPVPETPRPLSPTGSLILGPQGGTSPAPLNLDSGEAPPIYLTSAGAAQPAGASPLASPTLIDAKVGDINGRPIYADEFFEPMANAFSARARDKRVLREEWLAFVHYNISMSLDGIITDELLRAEALQRLTPAEEQGLRSFLVKAREQMIGKNYGSEQLAERKSREERGISLAQLMEDERKSILISIEIRESINRRVNISWRDVQQRYLRDFKEWNKDPVAMFRVIRVRESEVEAVEQITQRLSEGEDFETLAAESFNAFNPDTQGLQSTPFSGEFTEYSFFGPDALNEAAWALEPGQQAGPIEFSSLIFWVKLQSIDIRSVSLYDAQLAIERELLTERRQAELDRYIDRLVERARVSNREEIIESLYEIAVERYGSEG